MKGHNPREIAVSVLSAPLGNTDFMEDRLEKILAQTGLAGRDRALAQELVYGVVRWQATLDWLIARKTSGRTQQARLQVLLRLGLYQMLWLDRIPNYASVNETVTLARQLGLGHKAGFINALLRGYGREREATVKLLAELKKNQPGLGYSHPQWLCDRWLARWGVEKTVHLLDWNNTPAPTFARLNTLRTEPSLLLRAWQGEEVEFKERLWPWTGSETVYELLRFPALGLLPSFQKGWFYIQDPSTLLAVRELNPQPGDRVLDFCAAPGGKTTFMAQLMHNRGQVVAWDEQPERRHRLQENCERLGVACVSTQPPSEWGTTRFDKILVDAPCSNTGVMRRRIELRWRLKPADLAVLSRMQLAILTRVAPLLKPAGTLVYSTCSLEPEENQEVIKQFLAGHPNFRLEFESQLIPFADAVDGAYVARCQRVV